MKDFAAQDTMNNFLSWKYMYIYMHIYIYMAHKYG